MTHYNPTYTDFGQPPFRNARPSIPGWRRMVFILVSIAIIVTLLLSIKPAPAANPSVATQSQAPAQEAAVAGQATGSQAQQSQVQNSAAGAISPVFAEPVQYWAPQIAAWSKAYGLDPNLAATIMQVESCGDPAAVSSAGAQGLFQVMPFHFQPGEDSLDPDTNARRGLAYFVGRLEQTGGDVGRAFAGYNGGQRAAATSWDNWPSETQRYYVWTTGIYNEIQQGLDESPTLQRWLQSGGASLCRQATSRLGLQ